jgi:hypothetical protein
MTNVQLVTNKKHQWTQILVNFSGALNVTEATKLNSKRISCWRHA